jgi:outer membrane protein assembly factor BamD (BamD/ComL family)
VTAPHSQDGRVEDRSAAIHQETLKLATLIAVAIAAFFVTRAIAASNRSMTERDAAEWYARGERALREGDSQVPSRPFDMPAS